MGVWILKRGGAARWARRGALVLAAGLAGHGPAAAAEESVATALVVSVDVSQSVDEDRFRLQMEGIAEALEDPSVLAAITGNAGGIMFAMVTWADKASLAVGWRRIASRREAAAAAALVRAVPRQAGDFTCLGQMLRTVGASVLPALPVAADRVVIDVSGDGIDNCTDVEAIHAERDALARGGATINGLPILVPGENDVVGAGAFRSPGYGLRALPIGPQGGETTLDRWYRDHVLTGPGAFLLAAKGYGDFARALRQKFVLEISALEPGRARGN
ncbi:DUF1194 domain-containing protein [Methylobacterium durans]|uniref:DUF1194 domain-containing protein n=1 Tax=Methylobacterium durans TaxID=2202825 RepID=UPI002AFDE096|nr:DUF1194 domain-containing protein [Methylobacterium durans]MEA1831189.1 DUF1194 domain-containing protein [Methylobacterium durans]